MSISRRSPERELRAATPQQNVTSKWRQPKLGQPEKADIAEQPTTNVSGVIFLTCSTGGVYGTSVHRKIFSKFTRRGQFVRPWSFLSSHPEILPLSVLR
jgi:hypothetical protein